LIHEIRPYSGSDQTVFENLFLDYFFTDYKIILSEAQLIEICGDIIQLVKAGSSFLDLLFTDDRPIGFILYQKDSLDNEWCAKEGWGFIREIFVSRCFRKRGYGKHLVTSAEQKLKGLSVPGVYIALEDNPDFWLKRGYVETDEIYEKNDGFIFVKPFSYGSSFPAAQ
jgi:GNAT superfamily N-acetyltransferase